jgi:hypothetical protein
LGDGRASACANFSPIAANVSPHPVITLRLFTFIRINKITTIGRHGRLCVRPSLQIDFPTISR